VSSPLSDLVYDVGMNDGADTAYYLRRGYRVVAIEANPVLAEAAERRFGREIAERRLTVLAVGIADGEGTAPFWVCDDHSPWSSFDRAVARRGGARHHAIEVPLRSFGDILDEYGVPHYCKVDIEGNDYVCLEEMQLDRRPRFVSVELSFNPLLERLHALGFDRFRIIHQLSYTAANTRFYALKRLLPHPTLRAALERLHGLVRGRLTDGRWYFPVGSSGPLPERAPEPWLTYGEARKLRNRIEADFRRGRLQLDDSFDIHATDSTVLASQGR
jgi:FkbM family methyltransferase